MCHTPYLPPDIKGDYGALQINPAAWVNNALGGTGRGVFSSSWDSNGHGGGAIGTFGPSGSNQITLVDSATGQKFVLVDGCLATPVHPSRSSEPRSPPCILLNHVTLHAPLIALGIRMGTAK